jgi:hypothetical protein
LKLPALRQDLGFTLVVAASSVVGWLAARGVAAMGLHTLMQALAVFVAVTLCWLPWLGRYLVVVGQKLRGRYAAR